MVSGPSSPLITSVKLRWLPFRCTLAIGATVTCNGTLVTVEVRSADAGFTMQENPGGAPAHVNPTVPSNPFPFRNTLKRAVCFFVMLTVLPPGRVANEKSAVGPAFTMTATGVEFDWEIELKLPSPE